jgi:hypothetical protein
MKRKNISKVAAVTAAFARSASAYAQDKYSLQSPLKSSAA